MTVVNRFAATAAGSATITVDQLPGATRKPHVCFVAPEAWPVFSRDTSIEVVGGSEVQQSILARRLAAAGYPVSMICSDYGQPHSVLLDGVRVIKTHRPDAGWPGLRFIHPRLIRMWQVLREVNADIYYQRSADMMTAVVAAFCRRHGKHSIFAGASDSDFQPGKQEIRFARDRWLFERGLAMADTVVVQNLTQQEDCLTHYGRASTLIPSCYELPADARPDHGDKVLWVGTLRPGKRPELLLELARRMPEHNFVMIGGAPSADAHGQAYFQSIRSAATRLPNLEFTGFLPLARVEPYFDRARVVINTSVYEGMPNVFLQAWSRGVPTLAFIDVGARHNGAPLYRVPADTADAAAEIERLFADDLYHGRTAIRCRDYFAATHSCDGVVSRYRRLFDRMATRHTPLNEASPCV